MRVVHVSPYADPQQRAPEDLVEAWPTMTAVARAVARGGVHVLVVQASSQTRAIEVDGVAIHFVSARVSSRFRRKLGLWAAPRSSLVAKELAAFRPDVIHLNSLSFPLHARFLGAYTPTTPILVQDHADRPPRPWERAVYRAGLRGVAGVAFTAREQAKPFASVLPSGARVFEALESSTDFTPGDQDAARARTGLSGDPCLLWLGRLNANKDPLTVLDAVSRAAPALPDARLWCFFQAAPLLAAVERRVRGDSVLSARVRLMGARPHAEVEDLLRSADFLVQGSHTEGSGYAVIEALACGTVPVVTDIPSFRRITGRGSVGPLFPPGDADTMARALIDWAARDRGAIRRRAREHFVTSLSFDAVGRELRVAYEALRGG